MPPPPPPPPSETSSSYRTLNVKDALSYLEQVKDRFQDQNEVYNQFLDVMKLFKTQSIDTPGVIERVSTLFRGYPSLIQGFNTFLPPGFRIECSLVRLIPPNEQEADLVTFYTPGEITHKTSLFPRDGSPAIILTNHPLDSLPPGWIHVPTEPQSSSPENMADPQSPATSSTIPLSPVNQFTIAASPPAEQLESDPIPSKPSHPPSNPSMPSFVDPSHHDASDPTIKTINNSSTSPLEQESSRPPSQNSNLAAPSQASRQNQVSLESTSTSTSKPSLQTPQTNPPAPSLGSLSQGPSPGLMIAPATDEIPANARPTHPTPTSHAPTTGPHYSMEPTVSNNSELPIAPDLATTDSSHNLIKQPSRSPVPTRPNSTLLAQQPFVFPLQPPPNTLPNNSKPVEFNYAINYVNKIKHRFIDQPEIYKTFLEILQTYQRDGMPIDSVYVKVTKLFSNAADLLDEFKHFLPDLNASAVTGQVPKHAFPPPSKTSSGPKLPSIAPSSSSHITNPSTKTSHDQLSNSQFGVHPPLAHPQPLSYASSSLKSGHKITQDTSTPHRSQSSLQNNSTIDTGHDLTRHPSKKASPSRSQNHSKAPSTFARVASPDLPMVLDPQVLSSTITSALDPQVVNHAHPGAKLPVPMGAPSRNQSDNRFMLSDLPPHGRPSPSHPTSSVLPDSLTLQPKRFLNSHPNPLVPEGESFEPLRKKRAFGGPMKHPNRETANLTVAKDSYHPSTESDATAFTAEGLTAKKTKRLKNKNANIDVIAPAVSNESLPHVAPAFFEQHGPPRPHHSYKDDSTSHKIVGASDQYKPSSYTLPHHIVDGKSTNYAHVQLPLVQDSHLGCSKLTDYSIYQPSYIETHDAMGGRTLTNTKELMLFESIKKYLNDQEVWLEFLRVLDLYNQSIIDFKTLLDRVSVFIGDDDELLEDFKGLVGYDVKNDGLVEGEVWEIKNQDIKERDKVDASMIQKEYGPSYKRLPRAEIDLACSGRDELCWSVLNDEYFGAAKFGTESGGPGHRKTNFEEVIAMTEGERAHFSYWLECISRTIGHFESLQARIDRMDDQDKANFSLGENLGGISPSIYHRTLRKVYEAKLQTSILPYLRDYPVNTIPIVLRRLKELELSWKSAESQWNLIWREVERKNYYKAQDHQVLAFKSAEKSLLKGQNLLKEIQDLKNNNQETLVCTVSIKDEENENSEDSSRMLEDQPNQSCLAENVSITLESRIPEKIICSPSPSRASHQIELGFEDMEVFFDVLRIIIMALDRSTLSNPERRRIDESIRTFIPAIWNVSSSELEKQIPIIYDDESSSGEPSEDGVNPNQSNLNGGDGQTPIMDQPDKQSLLDQKGIQSLTEGLLKIQQTAQQQELTSEQRQRTRSQNLDTSMSSSPSHSYQLTPAEYVSSSNHLATTCPQTETCLISNRSLNDLNRTSFTGLKKWTKLSILGNHPPLANSNDQKKQQGRCYNVFGTSAYYLLIRLLHTLYSRLLKLKTIGIKLSQEKPRWQRINPVAIELGLSHPIIGLDDHPYPSTQLYPYCLDQLSRYFDGEIDFNNFEESIRVAFPKDGYVLSTVDKLTNSILKQFAQIHQEPKNKDLLHLLKRERSLNSSEPIVQISYRSQAESIIRTEEGEREEPLIQAEWHPERMSLSIQILNEDDPTFEVTNPIDRLTQYIDTFELDINSELVKISKIRTPFLRSNLTLVNNINNENNNDQNDKGESETNDEGNQLSQNSTINQDKKIENREMDSTHNPPGISLVDDQNQKQRKPRRVILINQSNIQVSIDPKTYKLKLNNHRCASGSNNQEEHKVKEATDLLFVKNLNYPSPSTTTITTTTITSSISNDHHLSTFNCFKNNKMDFYRVSKFESWFTDFLQNSSN